MKKVALSLGIIFTTLTLSAQKVFTKNGNISFFSSTSMEDIKADNNQVMSVLNTQSGELQFSLLVKGFHFQKALMEEHFNENYMESNKYPKAMFKGHVADMSKIDLSKDGSYPVNVSGDMTIHGVTKKVSAPGTITVSGGKIAATSKFPIRIADYNISVPKIVKNNIAESVDVTVNCNFDQKM